MRFVGPWPLLSLQPPTLKSTTMQTHTHTPTSTHHKAHTFIYTHCMPLTHYFSSSLIFCQESEMECYGADR